MENKRVVASVAGRYILGKVCTSGAASERKSQSAARKMPVLPEC